MIFKIFKNLSTTFLSTQIILKVFYLYGHNKKLNGFDLKLSY